MKHLEITLFCNKTNYKIAFYEKVQISLHRMYRKYTGCIINVIMDMILAFCLNNRMKTTIVEQVEKKIILRMICLLFFNLNIEIINLFILGPDSINKYCSIDYHFSPALNNSVNIK